MFSALVTPTAGAPAGAHAASRPLLTQPLAPHLNDLLNGVIARCVSAPRACAGVVAASAISAGTALCVAGLVDALLPSSQEPRGLRRPLLPVQQDSLVEQIHQLDTNDGVSLQAELLAIAAQCEGDRDCRAERINAVLERLPATSLARLQQWVDATTPPAISSTWPPSAHAAPLLIQDRDALPWLAQILAGLYTPEVAALQSDLEAIVAHAPPQPALAASDETINLERLATVEQLLRRDAPQVQRLPYTFIASREGPQQGQSISAYNLHATLAGSGSSAATTRRLLLVAHADMIGAARGSQGAIDNASGVAALLHVTRQLKDHAPANVAIELLITSNEELGLHGSRAYVDQCKQSALYPDLVLNVDMVGRGGHGLLLSTTGALQERQDHGMSPYFLQAATVSDVERDAEADLLKTFESAGFTRHQGHPGFMMTSDNLPFANASIATLAVAQGNAADAAALQALDDRKQAWLGASRAMDWSALDSVISGNSTLDDTSLTALKTSFHRVSTEWNKLVGWRSDHARATAALIHGSGDRLYRVDPRMAVDFADALVAFVQRWSDRPVADTALPTQGVRNA